MDYSLLETQGYIVIPKFLNNKELEFFRKDYVNSKRHEYLVGYVLYDASSNAIQIIEKKVNSVLTLISEQTNLNVDLMIPQARYFDNQQYYNETTRPGFHTDHQIFYFLQQFYNYLNFWIPITKPDPNKSGLTIIPFDKLAELMPSHVEKIINSGATRYITDGNTTKFINDGTGEETILPRNINEIAVSPELSAGDVLLMRGDLIHMGQDTDTDRVAVSLRCTQSSAPINKNKLFVGGPLKQKTIKNVPKLVQNVLDLCKQKNSDTITAGDFYRHLIEKYNKEITDPQTGTQKLALVPD